MSEPTTSASESAPTSAPLVSSRRARHSAAVFPDGAAPPVRRWGMVGATIVLSGLIALSAFASNLMFAAAVGLTGLVLALEWHPLLGLSHGRVPSAILALTAVAVVTVVTLTTDDPFLRHVPLVVAAALVVVFLHQLVRKPPRAQLTPSIAASVGGVMFLAAGSALLPLSQVLGGREILAAALTAVGAGALGDLLVGRGALHQWQLPISMLLGGWAAMAVGFVAGSPSLPLAALLGFLVAAVSHAVRRILAPHPLLNILPGQLAAAAASILSVGVVVYTFARVVGA